MGFRKVEKQGSDERNAQVRRVLWVILFMNLLVAAGKVIYGFMINSVSMQADGFHSTFDGTSNIVGLIGMALAARPADRDHPYGHGKYETYASAAIALMLVMAAWEIGSQAFEKLTSGGGTAAVDAGSFIVMGVTLVINIFVSRYEVKRGRELKSDILIADAAHTGSDILVSVGVLVGLGLVKMGFPLADPVIALGVSVAILWTAWGVFRQASEIFSDSARLAIDKVCAVAMGVSGVLGCHGIRTRGLSSQVYVDLHIQVDPNETVAKGHQIAEKVERSICEIPGVVDVIVHLEPLDDYQTAKTLEENNTER